MPRRLLIRNGIAALPHGPSRCDILCEGPRIVAIGGELEDGVADVFDASGLTVGPGLVDVHVHGGGGFSFFSSEPGAIRGYSEWVPARGVTSFDDAVERAKRYLDAGADAIFPEAMTGADELATFANRVKAPLLANMTEFGKTPLLGLDELAKIGYRMVIYPQTALRVAFGAITKMLADLKRDGHQNNWLDRMQTRKELYDLLDYDGLNAIDKAATGG